MENNITFEQLLNMFWLRPETAMWRELDIRAMSSFKFSSPSLDLGCGDGVFSFIRAGGKFDESFDAFQSVSELEKFFENKDVFDSFDEGLQPIVTKKPDYKIDVGFDHKENLLKKANKLDLYGQLKAGDANNKLPFEDESFRTVFSNIVYWLEKPELVLKEINRILMPGGRACLMLPNSTLPEFSFYNQLYVKSKDTDWAFLERLDRGRFSDNIRQARNTESWQEAFHLSGFQTISHVTHLSKLVIQIWDIGLRPLFPQLIKMTRALEPDVLCEIKKEWMDNLNQFILPIIQMDFKLSSEKDRAFHCFILEKHDVQ